VKILQVIARVNQGGTARWLEELIVGLRSNGHEVFLAAGYVQNGETEDEIFEKLSNSGLRVSEEAPSFWNTEASSNTVYSIDPTTGVAATQSGTQSSGQTVFSDFSENVSAPLGTQSKVGNENQGTSVNPDANSNNTTN
jgi:hypothetical protein